MKTRKAILLLLSSLLIACSNAVYVESHEVDSTGWDKDSVLSYAFQIADTSKSYDILLHLRHTENYPYQNMWLFMGSSDSVVTDTIEFYLADDRGIWLGNRGNGHISMPIIYATNYRFDTLGTYSIYVRHGMRTSQLPGITDITLEVKACK